MFLKEQLCEGIPCYAITASADYRVINDIPTLTCCSKLFTSSTFTSHLCIYPSHALFVGGQAQHANRVHDAAVPQCASRRSAGVLSAAGLPQKGAKFVRVQGHRVRSRACPAGCPAGTPLDAGLSLSESVA